ncbi:MAG: tetratricopeptide repeat protein [Planctomycetota bacterium]
MINNNNNVVVKGNVTASNPRPHISTRRLRHDIGHVRRSRRWKSHSGFYFSFNWSNSSCGRVAYLPYRYRHSWCRYPSDYYPYYGLSYYYPRYHRKYIYVSLGGYWPSYYRYRRYYWYGCHPYYWYGTNVISEPYQDVNYNTYNTYNTYSTYSSETSDDGFTGSGQSYYEMGEPDSSKVDEPEYETVADLCFARAVELFEAENYADAVLQFQEAVLVSPDDIILPFTYSQALFANGDYAHAAGVLREAIAMIPEDELTVYYPRGLYKDETILTEQIEQLEAAADKEPFGSDYQLLLGYQYLGIGELDKAYQPLNEAAQSVANTSTAEKLLELAAQLETETLENE